MGKPKPNEPPDICDATIDALHTGLKHGVPCEWSESKGRWVCPHPEAHLSTDKRTRPAPRRGLI